MWKRWRLWLPSVYVFLAIFGLSDDTRIFLFIISPPFWLTEGSQWFAKNITHPSNIPIALIFFVTLIFWGLIGLLIDVVIKRMKKIKTHLKDQSN